MPKPDNPNANKPSDVPAQSPVPPAVDEAQLATPVLYRHERFLDVKMPDAKDLNPGKPFYIGGKKFTFTNKANPGPDEIPLGPTMMHDIELKLAHAQLMGVVANGKLQVDKSEYLTEEELTAREQKELGIIETRVMKGELTRDEGDEKKAEKQKRHAEFRAKAKVRA